MAWTLGPRQKRNPPSGLSFGPSTALHPPAHIHQYALADAPCIRTKIRRNLAHLFFSETLNDAGQVLESPFRLDVKTVRNNEQRIQSFAYIFDRLAVLTVVHIEDDEHIISFRRASRDEREVYHEWLENEFE